MTLTYRHLVIGLVVAHALACRAPRADLFSIEERFDALSRADQAAFELPDRAREILIGTAYDARFTAEHGASLASAKDRDLDLLFRAARIAALHTLEPQHIRHMQSALDELQSRGLALTRHYLHMHAVLVQARSLADARELARRHPLPQLEPVPALRDAEHLEPDRPTELVLDPAGNELLRRNVDLRGVRVVVVSHPRCHFSSAAMRDIQADPVLSRLFSAHARWLAPQDGGLALDLIRRWNRDHPGQETTFTFRREDWPMIDSWGTPTFYVLDNGVLKAKVEGWPRGGRRAELLAAFRQVGLAP